MSYASLASRYRPQTFAEVTGQDTVKEVLSRAAAKDKVAPAYLLSGTRGVGKTTIARIFAKALNCAHAPAPEPCNACPACRAITQGSYVDVVEIDGASNRGIDDARRLRDAIGYAPMEGRYKVFIIDEAHMLTKEAFNALLKTLEEPPAHATFILATTEPHKFPVTIVSRCQHFVFKAISEPELAAHLVRVLQREGLSFEERAVHLLARRAAGSVRDGMSLLGQTLALGGDNLTETAVRSVLGLAGQELYERLLIAVRDGDCVAVSRLTADLLELGADIGFFLRELAQMWRNMFLLRQAGEAALPLIDMPEAEKKRLAALASDFSLTAVHAAWQMTLEGQRQVLNSLEPGAALELLLLNLALTPSLASLEIVSRAQAVQSRAGSAANTLSSPAAPASSALRSEPSASKSPAASISAPASAAQAPEGALARRGKPDAEGSQPGKSAREHPIRPPRSVVQAGTSAAPQPVSPAVPPSAPLNSATAASRASSPEVLPASAPSSAPVRAAAAGTTPPAEESRSGRQGISAPVPAAGSAAEAEKIVDAHPAWPCAWQDFLAFCAPRLNAGTPLHLAQLQAVDGQCLDDKLVLTPHSRTLRDLLADPARMDCLQRIVDDCAGRKVAVVLLRADVNSDINEGQIKQNMAQNPAVQVLQEHFDATILRCLPVRQSAGAVDNSGEISPRNLQPSTASGDNHAQHE